MALKIKPDSKLKIPVTLETLELPKKICDKRCRICNDSKYLKKVHVLKKAGQTYRQIINILSQTYDFEISKSSISRHFKNYYRQKTLISSQIINKDLIEEATKQSVHIKKLVILIDKAFAVVSARVSEGTLLLGIDDLDKLMKLRYQILRGEDTDEGEVLAIFQRASDKYGLNLSQGILFKPKKRTARPLGDEAEEGE